MPTDSTPLYAPPSFCELYCALHRLAPDAYEQAVLRRALYGHARWLVWVAERFGVQEYFAPDREFVRGVGGLTGVRWFHVEAVNYHTHPEQERFCRRVLRMRISAGRLRALLEETFEQAQREETLIQGALERWRQKYGAAVWCGWRSAGLSGGVHAGL